MVITASDLRNYQSCRRRWLLERSWRVARWRPQHLFRACLREGVFQLSTGCEIAIVRTNQRTRFLSEAARPGLDFVSGDPWTVAQDWAGMISTVLTALSRLATLPRIDGLSWLPSTWIDDSGTLHRWITASMWNDDALAREAHGWPVIADMVMLDAPLQLHVVEIGQQRDGRRYSPWARGYRHPIIAGQFRFQRPDGKGGWRKLSGEHWRPLWYADQTKPDPEAWCDLMDADHVTPSLLHHISMSQPSPQASRRVRAEIAQLASEMQAAATRATRSADGMAEPMARGACDPMGGPCQWQNCCFAPDPDKLDIGSLGLYQIRQLPETTPLGLVRSLVR